MNQPKSGLDELRIDRAASPEDTRTPWMAIGIALALVVVVAAFGLARARAVTIRTEVVREEGIAGGVRTVLNASGYVVARREATVSSKVTGKVVEVLVEEGMKVEQDQVLARLDDTNVRAGLRLAEAERVAAHAALAETRARLDDAEKQLSRTAALARQQVASASDLDHAEAEVKSLRARLEQQQTQTDVADKEVALWQQQLDDTVIRAPFSGIAVSKNAQPGEMISPVSAGGGFTRTGIGTIVDMKSLEIEVEVNESFLNRVHAAQPVEARLDAYPEWKIPGRVLALIPTADRQKSTVKVRVTFDQLDPRILPQMGVRVAFLDPTRATPVGGRVVLVPKSAVRQDHGQDVVFVVREGRAQRQPVTLGETRDQETAVTAGLSPGDRVVVDGPPTLADGARVREKKP